jgi:tRNA(Arg) A34 adenosine deaminase TadA
VSSEVDWTRLTVYTTAEPCPLCAAAVAWAGIPRVVYGASIPWLVANGWWQIHLRADELFARARGRQVALRGGVLESACASLFLAARET